MPTFQQLTVGSYRNRLCPPYCTEQMLIMIVVLRGYELYVITCTTTSLSCLRRRQTTFVYHIIEYAANSSQDWITTDCDCRVTGVGVEHVQWKPKDRHRKQYGRVRSASWAYHALDMFMCVRGHQQKATARTPNTLSVRQKLSDIVRERVTHAE